MPAVARSWSSHRRIIVGAIAIVGLGLSAYTYLASRQSEDQQIRAEFIRRAEVRSAQTRENIAHFEGGLFGLSHLLTASENVSRHEFAVAANAMLARYPNISALEWVAVVPEEERAEVEQKISEEFGKPFEFVIPDAEGGMRRAPSVQDHFPILYVEPMAGNERAFGFDLAFGPTTKDLANARRHRQVTVSRRIKLVQETEDRSSVIFIWPVFKIIDDRSKFLGYVQGIFRLSDMLTSELHQTDGAALDILWLDPRETEPEYRELFSTSPDRTHHLTEADFDTPETFSLKINVGDRYWLALHRPNQSWLDAQKRMTPWWLFLSGLAITTLLSTLINVFLRRTETVEQLVKERTEELEQQRLLLSGLMESLPGMAYRCKPGNPPTFLYASQGAHKLCGYSPEEFLNGAIHIPELIHPDDRVRSIAVVRHALKNKRPYAHEYRINTRGGKLKWVLAQGHGVYDQNGELSYFEGLIIEISERKLIEEQNLALERRLYEGQKHESLGLMAGGVAHDFNNLLTGILGHTALARMELPAGSSADKHLQQIEISSQRSADLCAQMLAFAGRGRLSNDVIDLNKLLTALQPLLRSTVSKKIDLGIEPDEVPPVTGDVAQIKQIILNLVINASEAIGDQPGTITLTTSTQVIGLKHAANRAVNRELAPGKYAVVTITDTGPGIPKDKLGRIFDPFFTTKFTGRGLGLAAASGVARGHNGALHVTSEESEGATFTLFLPANEQAPERGPVATAKRLKKALIIDDDQPVLNVVTGLLASMDIEAVTGLGGPAALKIFQERADDFDLVLLDIVMPGLNGPDTLARLRAIKPNIPVLMMSGLNDPDTIAELATRGPLVFISKPFTRKQLQETLNSLMTS